ncbi:S8 family serine peptidase [Cloacibacillus sp.]|uniref:S8 family serine peptidase n=1 Tax=Cloacibacillus sp. TaxID=2049023 RepID=UPI0025C1888A|nr:S8 family serine peptidase [Cloacibacillus sp.]MCC8057541.1 S8 family serine peptidase [Cloacibacillus sp.]
MMISSQEKTTEELIKELKKDSNVLSAVPNYIHYISTAKKVEKGEASGQSMPAAASPNDPKYNELWGLRAINAPSAWDKTTGKEDVYVVVLDTGIDHEHEDLAGNLGTFNGNYAGCGVLQIYDFYEKDMETGKEKLIRTEIMKISGQFDPDDMNLDSWGDLQSHGTHVAGTIGAVGNNSLGVIGVNWKVRLLGIGTTKVILNEDDKVVDIEPGELSDGQVIKGLNIILQQKKAGLNIRAVNMSFGDWYTPQYQLEESPYYVALKAVSDAGVILVAAVGNEFQNLDAPGGPGSDPRHPKEDYRGKICYPACYKLANLIAVGAVSTDKSWCDFSNYSPNYVDIAAPGAEIISTLPRYVWSDDDDKVISQDLYGEENGTSMAAPHVTGAVALLCAAYPDKTAGEIKELLLNNADKNFAKEGKSAYGMLDLGAAMKAGAPAPTPTPKPSGGSSGCNGGIPFVALLSVMAVAFFKKKR